MISYSEKETKLSDLVTFVAIKNGEHQSKGFAYFSDGISEFAPPPDSHVARSIRLLCSSLVLLANHKGWV